MKSTVKSPRAVIWSCLSVVWESCVIAGSQMKEVNEGKADSLLILCACTMSAYTRGITKTALGWQCHNGMAQSLCHSPWFKDWWETEFHWAVLNGCTRETCVFWVYCKTCCWSFLFVGAVSDAIQMQKEWSFTRISPLLTALYRKVCLPGVTQRTLLCWAYIHCKTWNQIIGN